MGAHLSAPPPRPTSSRPELPAGFDEVVAQGMAKDPAARPASAGDLAAAARAELGTRPDPESAPWRVSAASPATAVVPPAWTSASHPGTTRPRPGDGQAHLWPPAHGQPSGAASTVVADHGPPPAGRPGYPWGPSYPNGPGGTPRVAKPSGGRGAIIGVAVLSVLALVAVGITWAVLNGGRDGRPVAEPTTSATGPVTPTPSATPTVTPTAVSTATELDRLLADLPEGYEQEDCSVSTVADSAAIASVRCNEPAVGVGVSGGIFVRYADVQAMNREFDVYADGHRGAASQQLDDCDDGSPVRITYDRGGVTEFSGQLLCYSEDGFADLAWTDNAAVATGIVSNYDGDIGTLYRWWQANRFTTER